MADYNRFVTALGGGVLATNNSYCPYGCPDLSEDDILKIASEPRLRREKVIEKLSAGSVLTEVEQIRVQHVLTDTEEQAKNVIKLLEGGADFTKLANEQSKEQIENINAGRPSNGGVIEWFAKEGSSLVQPFVDCAWAVEKGKYSQPCKSDFGWHVIKVLDRDPKRPREQSQIDSLKDKLYTDWLAKAKAASTIESVIPAAPVIPTQPAIVEPTAAPVQPQTPVTGTGTITTTTPLTTTSPLTTTVAATAATTGTAAASPTTGSSTGSSTGTTPASGGTATTAAPNPDARPTGTVSP